MPKEGGRRKGSRRGRERKGAEVQCICGRKLMFSAGEGEVSNSGGKYERKSRAGKGCPLHLSCKLIYRRGRGSPWLRESKKLCRPTGRRRVCRTSDETIPSNWLLRERAGRVKRETGGTRTRPIGSGNGRYTTAENKKPHPNHQNNTTPKNNTISGK